MRFERVGLGEDLSGWFKSFYLVLITTRTVAIKHYKNMSAVTINSVGGADEKPDWLEVVRQQVGSLRFGVVQIVVHDSQVTQIEKTERVRLDKPKKI